MSEEKFKTNSKTSVIIILILLFSLACLGLFIMNTQRKDELQKDANIFYTHCFKKPRWRDCYANEFASLIKKRNIHYTLEVLDELQKRDKRTLSCHSTGHVIAFGELSKNHDSWSQLAKWMDIYRCSNGFFHGLMEELLAEKKLSLDSLSLGNFCQKIEDNFSGVKVDLMTNCYHVLGHFLLLEYEGDIDKSIKICSEFKHEGKSYFCNTGVFMEEFVRAGLNDHGIRPFLKYNWENTAKEEEICKNFKSPVAETCWREIATIYASLASDYPPKIFEYCARSGNQKYQAECYRYAVYIMVFGSYYKNAKEETLCDPLLDNSEAYKECIKGEVIAFKGSANSFQRADNLCNVIPKQYKSDCNQYKLDWYGYRQK